MRQFALTASLLENLKNKIFEGVSFISTKSKVGFTADNTQLTTYSSRHHFLNYHHHQSLVDT